MTPEILEIIEYYFELYANELGNLDEMDRFPEKHKIPKLYKEETRNLETNK